MTAVYYRDRAGAAIADVIAWSDLHRDPEYHFVARDSLPNGVWVATIWEGVTFRPLFSTGVFASPPPGLGIMLREESSETEADARATHARLVAEYRDK